MSPGNTDICDNVCVGVSGPGWNLSPGNTDICDNVCVGVSGPR